VIEELIGEEIIDESDVFVDVHKAIRRLAPAPQKRFKRDAGGLELSYTHDSYVDRKDGGETEPLLSKDETPSRKTSMTNGGPGTTFLIRRKSSTASDPANGPLPPVAVRSNTSEMREHLKHLGPSNAASKPRATKYTSVKIKPGVGTIPEGQATTKGTDSSEPQSARSRSADATPDAHNGTKTPDQESEADRLIRSAGKEASGGAAAIRAVGGYGTMGGAPTRPSAMPRGQSAYEASRVAESKALSDAREREALSFSSTTQPPPSIDGERARDLLKPPEKMVVGSTGAEGEDGDTVGDLTPSRQRSQSRRQARSGSITETEVEVGGFTKVVLEMSSSSEEDEAEESKSGKGRGSGSSKD
jgi:metal transporter CNNM